MRFSKYRLKVKVFDGHTTFYYDKEMFVDLEQAVGTLMEHITRMKEGGYLDELLQKSEGTEVTAKNNMEEK